MIQYHHLPRVYPAKRIMQAYGVIAMLGVSLWACRPSNLLDVPPPDGIIANAQGTQSGAETAFTGAKIQMFAGVTGSLNLLPWISVITDEFDWSAFSIYYLADEANIDARVTTATGGFEESGDRALPTLLSARSALLVAENGLQQYEPAGHQASAGEAYALAGYTELFLAEDYCAGVPLSAYVANGGIVYGKPLTTDSLLAIAEGHFDSALVYATSNDTIKALASIGLGRARLDRGHYDLASAAVQNVSTTFIYNAESPPSRTDPGTVNVYASQFAANYGCGQFNVADHEGGNGLNFLSSHDPRLVLDSTIEQTCDGGTWYYPVKFGNPATYVPLATGLEARLVEAEAALQDTPAQWLTDLNALRTDGSYTVPSPGDTVYNPGTGGVTGLAPLTDPQTDSGRVSLMFRERAFWLFGTGTRLGDLRRLVRQYARDPDSVFPVGPYPNGANPNLPSPIPRYGTDVSLTLPTAAGGETSTDPYYKGCLTPTSQA